MKLPRPEPKIADDLLFLFEEGSREYDLLNNGTCPRCAGPVFISRTANFESVFLKMDCRQCNITSVARFNDLMEQYELGARAEQWIRQFIAQVDLQIDLDREEQYG